MVWNESRIVSKNNIYVCTWSKLPEYKRSFEVNSRHGKLVVGEIVLKSKLQLNELFCKHLENIFLEENMFSTNQFKTLHRIEHVKLNITFRWFN